MEAENEPSQLIIGYFPFRAKAQMIRLLCQYLHIPYRDRFFTPDEWSKFKEAESQGWVLKDIPYIKHEDFMITGSWAPIRYIVDLSNNLDLLGRTQKDKIRLDQLKNRVDLKDSIISLITNNRSSSSCQKKRQCISQFYERKVQPTLLQYEQESCPENFFFGYITVFDFVIYQVINYLTAIHNSGLAKLPKLVALRNRVAEIPQIKVYEESSRAVKELCPVQFFQKFKKEKMSLCKGLNSNSKGQKDINIE